MEKAQKMLYDKYERSFAGIGRWSNCTFMREIFVQNTEDADFSDFIIEIVALICYNNL